MRLVRQMMLKDLMARAPEISEEVQAALQSRDMGSLLPESSRSKQLIDDIAVVQRQVVEDILPVAASEAQAVLGSAVRDGPALAESVAQRGPALLSLLQDPARAFNLVQQEARNTVTRTPEGLETPSYRVTRQGDGYEVREYEGYEAASTALAEGESDLVDGALGVNALSAFFFGGNADAAIIELTTPARLDVGGVSQPIGAKRLAFALPAKYAGAAATPVPSDGAVRIEKVGAQRLAVKEFGGFATGTEARK